MMDNTYKFESTIRNEITSYLELRESEGHQINKVIHVFTSLDRFLQEISFSGNNLSADVLDGWVASLPDALSVNTINVYLSTYKQFAKYLQSSGYNAFIPEKAIGNKDYLPYIFHEDELTELINAADTIAVAVPNNNRHTAVCFSIMIRMYIGCGFRLNEIRLLKTNDVDIKTGVVYVKKAKGNRDRLVPMHETLSECLRIYIKSGIPQKEGWFFPSKTGHPISSSAIREMFCKCLKEIGIEKPELKKHARNICLHCLRHSFAVTAFRQLERKGIDLYDEIPILSTYMGHENIYGTEHYLHLTTENRSDILSKMEKFNKGLFPEVSE